MKQEQFEKNHQIAAKVFEKHKKNLTPDSYDYVRAMLAELELECNIRFHGVSSVKIKELETKAKELESPNDYYQQPEPEITAEQLAAKLNAQGYVGKLIREIPFFNNTVTDSQRAGLYTEILYIGK